MVRAGRIVRVASVQLLQPLVSLILTVLIFLEAMTVSLINATLMILTEVAQARKG